MKPTPSNWPRLSTAVYYQHAGQAIDWLCKAFSFEIRLKIESDDGQIEHSELTYGEALVMVSEERRAAHASANRRSPKSIGNANTQNIMIYVDDVLAHYERARKAGAVITMEPKVSDYGDEYWSDQTYECEDLEGHRWWFAQRLRDAKV